MDDECPLLHYLAETKLIECYALRDAQVFVDLPAQQNHNKDFQSYANAMSTKRYEDCLVGAPAFNDALP